MHCGLVHKSNIGLVYLLNKHGDNEMVAFYAVFVYFFYKTNDNTVNVAQFDSYQYYRINVAIFLDILFSLRNIALKSWKSVLLKNCARKS